MHKIIVILVLFLFLLEDILQLKTLFSIKVFPKFDRELSYKNKLISLDFLRLLQLLFLGFLLSTYAGNPTTVHGQINVILAGMQFIRFLGKRIIQYQSILGIIQILQVISLVTLLILPFENLFSQDYSLSLTMKLTIFAGLIYAFFSILILPFSISFFVKLLSSESSSNFTLFPPLFELEKWCIKLSSYSIFFGISTAFILFFNSGLSFLSIGFIVSVICQTAAVWLSRKPIFNGFHSTSHILWSISALLLYLLTIYRVTSITNLI